MKIRKKHDTAVNHSPHVEDVSGKTCPPASIAAPEAPVIGTVDQWQSLSVNGRTTLTLLDQRVRAHISLDTIRDFFSAGPGTGFPDWARAEFLARVARRTADDLPSTPTDTGESASKGDPDAEPNGDCDTDERPPQTISTPVRQSITRPRRASNASEVYLPAPTLILRSATCRGMKGKNRKQRKYAPIAALDGIHLRGKGRMLSALDLIPWLGAVKIVRAKRTRDVVTIALRSLLEAIGRPDGTRSRQLLVKQLKRIGKFKIKLDATWGATHTVYAGPLLCDFKMLKGKSANETEFQCSISTELLRVFQAGETYLKIRDLKALSQRPLCLWLWGFYVGHERPFAMFVETLQGLAGFDGPTCEFRRQLTEGLEFLKTQKLIASWDLDRNTDKMAVIHRPRGNEPADGLFHGHAAQSESGPAVPVKSE